MRSLPIFIYRWKDEVEAGAKAALGGRSAAARPDAEVAVVVPLGVARVPESSSRRSTGTRTNSGTPPRTWLDAVGTPIAVQQKLMRHADIRTTMNVYGDVVTDEMAIASGKVAGLALNGTGSGTEPTSSH